MVDHEEIWEYLCIAEGLLWFVFVFLLEVKGILRCTETVQLYTDYREPYG